MKKSKMILAAAAVVLPLSVAGGSALAYFTANTTASGGYPVWVGTDTVIEEEFGNWTKHITITNSANSNGGGPVYVRAKAFSGDKYSLKYSGSGWSDGGDGYWYYTDNGYVLKPGESTSVLDVKIENVPADEAEKEEFNVIVIYERMPVQYDESGNVKDPKKLDWSEFKIKEEDVDKLTASSQTPGDTDQPVEGDNQTPEPVAGE